VKVHADPYKPSFLIADPHPESRSQLEDLCRERGWISACWDCKQSEMVQNLGMKSFDFIVVDAEIPHSAGMALLDSLKTGMHQVPMVVVIGKDPAATTIPCNTTLERPLNINQFEETVTQLIALRESVSRLKARTPADLGSEISVVSSREVAESGFEFGVIDSLHGAGLLTDNEKLRLQLALQEAIANSLEHGNLELPSLWREEVDASGEDRFSREKRHRLLDDSFASRSLTILTDFDGERLLIRITDEGPGFKVTPSAPSTLATAAESVVVHGRGLAIMNSVMDSVEYGLEGRQISLMKRICKG
jgi:anti-sigma regulatory factor (Ser/Thr protein kinase)/FixJ family two-component response regulator